MPVIQAHFPTSAPASTEVLGLLRRLENGGILLGRVLRTGPTGQTPIQVGSTVLPLIVPEGLDPGLLVSLRSEGGKILIEPQPAGQAQAALAESASTGKPTTTPAPTATPVAALLAANPALARVLQFYNLPLELETLQSLQSVLGKLPPDQAPLLAFLLAKNIPITAGNLLSIRERLRARGDLGKELSRLTSEIGALLGSGDIRGAERLSALLVELQQLLTWDPTGDLDTRIRLLRDFLAGLEEKLLGPSPDRAKGDFKSLLLELDDLLAKADLSQDHPLRASARKIIELLEGAHLTALSQSPRPDPQAWTFWRFPFPGEPQPTTVELAARGDRDPENPERYDPQNMEALVQVDLSNLGTVRVHLRSQTEKLFVALLVTDTRVHDLLVPELPGLVRTLESLGYRGVQPDLRVEALSTGSLADLVDPLKPFQRRIKDTESPHFDIRL